MKNDDDRRDTEACRSDSPPKHPSGDRTELDVSELLLQRYGHLLRYSSAEGWYAWSETHWAPDSRERAREYAKSIARLIAAEACKKLDSEAFAAAKRAGSARGIGACLDLARSDPSIRVEPDQFDKDPWLLNTPSDTVDLRTGEARPHSRADLITRVTNAAYNRNATSPTFERFLAEIQPSEEMRAYLARLFGYAVIGTVREHILAVFWGIGANGKSVLADAVTFALGGYAKPGPGSLIVSNGQHEPHPTDVATLMGARLVIAHETKRGASFDASKVKLLTGGDRLTARHMREDFFDFTPTHTILLLSNYQPQADASDSALWRRVQLIPFDVVIPPEKRNPGLADAIRREAPGVLRWIVEGALDYLRVGLSPPKVVLEQTARYRASEDLIGQFLEEQTVKLSQAQVRAGVLYGAFKAWSEDAGQRAVRQNEFAAELMARGFAREKRTAGMFYRGIGLLSEPSDQGSP